MSKKINFLSWLRIYIGKLEKLNRRKGKPPLENGQSDKVDLNWKKIKYIPKFLTKREKIILRTALIIIVVSLGLMVYVYTKENLVIKPKVGGVYTESVVGSPQYINPLYSSVGEVDRDLVKLVFAGLVKFNENQKIVPDLAQEWFMDEEGVTYTFKLRDDVFWPDGKKFSSEDVIFTYESIKNPAYSSPLVGYWSNIEIVAIDESTVQFKLPEPFAPFLENLTIGILPYHLWSDILPENARLTEFNMKPIGLGPYQFDSFIKDKQGFIKSYTLKRNPNYHLGSAYVKQITFKFYPTFEMAVDSLRNKNSDGLSFLPLNLKEFLSSRKDLNYYSLSLPQYSAVFFNQKNNAVLEDVKLREALELAVNRQQIIELAMQGEAQPISIPVLPGFLGYDAEQNIEQKLDQAKALLAELGYQYEQVETTQDKNEDENNTTTAEALENGRSKFLFKDDKQLTLELTLANQEQSIATAEILKQTWENIGIKINLNIVNSNEIQKKVIELRDYKMLLFGQILGSELDLYPFWHSSQTGKSGLNLAEFENEKADELLEKIRRQKDNDEKTNYYVELSKIFNQEIPAIFLFNPKYTYVVSNDIKGIDIERIITPSDRFNGVESWYVKTKKGFK